MAESLPLANALIGVSIVFMTVYLSIVKRAQADWKLAVALGVPSMLVSLIGVEVLVTFDPTWIRRGLGFLMFAIFVALLAKQRIKSTTNSEPPTAAYLLRWPRGLSEVVGVAIVT